MTIERLEDLEYQEFCLIAANDVAQEQDVYGEEPTNERIETL